MYVIQNFSSQAMSKINVFDRLVWLIGLIQYKSLGYKTKLYCMPEDIKFLKENFLYHYYDEIDVITLSQCDWLQNINLKEFWFFRKIIAMENEFKLRHDFFYSDTDIIINTPLNFEDCDAAQSVLLADNWILIVTLKDFIRDLLNTLLVSDFKDEYYWFLQDKSVQALLQLDLLYNEIMKMY